MLKRCNSCGRELDLKLFNRDRSQKDGLDRRCRECSKKHYQAMKEKHGEVMRARRRARHAERSKNDRAYVERVRELHRENARKRRKTPAQRERDRQYARDAYARRKVDPEQWAQYMKAASDRLREIRENDPERYADMLEARRINRRLRRLENGLPVRNLKRREAKITVPSAPLKPLLDRWIKNRETEVTHKYDPTSGASIQPSIVKTLADRAGVSTKLIYRIRHPKPGDGDRIRLESADTLCYAMDVPYELIYGDVNEEGEDE